MNALSLTGSLLPCCSYSRIGDNLCYLGASFACKLCFALKIERFKIPKAIYGWCGCPVARCDNFVREFNGLSERIPRFLTCGPLERDPSLCKKIYGISE